MVAEKLEDGPADVPFAEPAEPAASARAVRVARDASSGGRTARTPAVPHAVVATGGTRAAVTRKKA
jgi:hypothetical protein